MEPSAKNEEHVSLSLRVDAAWKAAITSRAKDAGTSVAAIVRDALDAAPKPAYSRMAEAPTDAQIGDCRHVGVIEMSLWRVERAERRALETAGADEADGAAVREAFVAPIDAIEKILRMARSDIERAYVPGAGDDRPSEQMRLRLSPTQAGALARLADNLSHVVGVQVPRARAIAIAVWCRESGVTALVRPWALDASLSAMLAADELQSAAADTDAGAIRTACADVAESLGWTIDRMPAAAKTVMVR